MKILQENTKLMHRYSFYLNNMMYLAEIFSINDKKLTILEKYIFRTRIQNVRYITLKRR